MSWPFTATKDQGFGDSFLDISRSSRRLVRVTTKTYETIGTYLFIKMFKKGSDDEYYIDQRITSTVQEFKDLMNNIENINMGPVTDGKKEQVSQHAKRYETPISPKLAAKSSRLSNSNNTI